MVSSKESGVFFVCLKYFLHVAENANFHCWIRFKVTMSAASPCFRRWDECLSLFFHIPVLLLRNCNKGGGQVTERS